MVKSFKITSLFPFLSLLLLLFSNCGSDDNKNVPDISNIKADVTILRFEQELFAVDTNKIEEGLTHLETKYPTVANQFFGPIIAAKQPNQTPPQYLAFVKQFLTDSFVRHTADTSQIVFKNFEPYKKELNQAARFYQYYFPNKPVPAFVTFVSQYNYDVYPFGRDTIGIGLDFFLGAQHGDYEHIENLRYEYIRRTLTPEHLVAKTMRLLIQNITPPQEGNRLIDMVINNGKQLYILDQLLPYTPDSIKFGYSAAQTQWCKDNEAGIWSSFLKENVVYETNFKKIGKLVTPSPNSPGMPQEAPGETGNYIGWQIVKQYMQRNPNTSLEQLLSLQDAQQILEKSKYKPSR